MLLPSALTHSIASGETKDRLLMINVGDVTEEYLRVWIVLFVHA